jgi:hypothetical protein
MDESKLIGGDWLVVKQEGAPLVLVEIMPGVMMKMTEAQAAAWRQGKSNMDAQGVQDGKEKSQRDGSRGAAGAPEEKGRVAAPNKARRHGATVVAANKAG